LYNYRVSKPPNMICSTGLYCFMFFIFIWTVLEEFEIIQRIKNIFGIDQFPDIEANKSE
jgi:hypothetical protein